MTHLVSAFFFLLKKSLNRTVSGGWFYLDLSLLFPPWNLTLLRPTCLIKLNKKGKKKETHLELSVFYTGDDYWISFQHRLPGEI